MSKRKIAFSLFAAGALALSGCSAGSLGSSDDSSGGGKVSLTFLVDNGTETVKIGNQLIKDFTAKNPNISISLDTRPQGTDGDNLIKTRLATGEMADVFKPARAARALRSRANTWRGR